MDGGQSLPVGERGSKHRYRGATRSALRSSPCGAWIETPALTETSVRALVAPRAGARIETCGVQHEADVAARHVAPGAGGVDRNYYELPLAYSDTDCRPPCGGVDRNVYGHSDPFDFMVAPRAGGVGRNGSSRFRGPPCCRAEGVDRNKKKVYLRSGDIVAPRTGAWIETTKSTWARLTPLVAPVRGRGSKRSYLDLRRLA